MYKTYEEFVSREKTERISAIRILGIKVGSTIKRVFDKATKENDYIVPIVKRELIRITEEAREINEIGDKNYEIFWRGMNMFNKYPKVEQGHPTSTMKKTHANITIKLNGVSKRIHLVLWNM